MIPVSDRLQNLLPRKLEEKEQVQPKSSARMMSTDPMCRWFRGEIDRASDYETRTTFMKPIRRDSKMAAKIILLSSQGLARAASA
jgi:hypothetical protein